MQQNQNLICVDNPKQLGEIAKSPSYYFYLKYY